MVLQVIIGLLIIAGLVALGFIIGKWYAESKGQEYIQNGFKAGCDYTTQYIRQLVHDGLIGIMDGKIIETSKFVALKQAKEAEDEHS